MLSSYFRGSSLLKSLDKTETSYEKVRLSTGLLIDLYVGCGLIQLRNPPIQNFVIVLSLQPVQPFPFDSYFSTVNVST